MYATNPSLSANQAPAMLSLTPVLVSYVPTACHAMGTTVPSSFMISRPSASSGFVQLD